MARINAIGDIHGRQNWKDIVQDDAVNVFVGDYFDPYSSMTEDKLIENFLDIVDFKRDHPETVLLYGNHDLHYIVPEHGGSTSRYNRGSARKFKELFDEFEDMFNGIAYAPDTRHLITHAGVTRPWLDKYLDRDDFSGIWLPDGSKVPTTKEMELFINTLWNQSEHKDEFCFSSNRDFWDTYGDTPTQSPIWIRPESLIFNNAYKDTDVIQIVGHTQVYKVEDLSGEIVTEKGKPIRPGIVLVDCLGHATESYQFECHEQ